MFSWAENYSYDGKPGNVPLADLDQAVSEGAVLDPAMVKRILTDGCRMHKELLATDQASNKAAYCNRLNGVAPSVVAADVPTSGTAAQTLARFFQDSKVFGGRNFKITQRVHVAGQPPKFLYEEFRGNLVVSVRWIEFRDPPRKTREKDCYRVQWSNLGYKFGHPLYKGDPEVISFYNADLRMAEAEADAFARFISDQRRSHCGNSCGSGVNKTSPKPPSSSTTGPRKTRTGN